MQTYGLLNPNRHLNDNHKAKWSEPVRLINEAPFASQLTSQSEGHHIDTFNLVLRLLTIQAMYNYCIKKVMLEL